MRRDTSTPDLFSYVPPPAYPEAPGARPVDTSVEAAADMRSRAATLRQACLEVLAVHPAGLTADEIAAKLRESVLSIRPRLSELKRLEKVRDTGDRRENLSGKRAAVMARI